MGKYIWVCFTIAVLFFLLFFRTSSPPPPPEGLIGRAKRARVRCAYTNTNQTCSLQNLDIFLSSGSGLFFSPSFDESTPARSLHKSPAAGFTTYIIYNITSLRLCLPAGARYPKTCSNIRAFPIKTYWCGARQEFSQSFVFITTTTTAAAAAAKTKLQR